MEKHKIDRDVQKDLNYDFFHNFYPWICFSIFFLTNSLLAYFSIPGPYKIWLMIFGLLTPALLALRTATQRPHSQVPFYEQDPFSKIRSWNWFLLLAIAAFLRFYELTTLSTWPVRDEGQYGYFAMRTSEALSWNSLFSYHELSPVYIGFLTLFFKLFTPSLFSLWLFPALVSLFTVLFAYLAARQFFSRSFSFVVTGLWSVSFWPLYIGRYSLPHVLLVLWQLVAFALIGFIFRQKDPRTLIFGCFFLGLISGIGIYLGYHWILMSLLLAIFVLGLAYRHPDQKIKILIPFFTVSFLIYIPFVIKLFNHSNSDYILSLWAFKTPASWIEEFKLWVQYLSGFFWGVDPSQFGYKPFWGGLLDSMSGSLLILGLIEILSQPFKRFNPWILLLLFFFLLPGLLSTGLELLRMILVLPILLILIVIAFLKLIETFSEKIKDVSLFFLFIITAAFSFYHLAVPYHDFWRKNMETTRYYTKSLESQRAYQILSDFSEKNGPGIIFTEFVTNIFDQTFAVSVYPFNASQNAQLSLSESKWVGLLTNVNYVPFLIKSFPEGRCIPLTPINDPYSQLSLDIIPITPSTQSTFSLWLKMERSLHPITFLQLSLPQGQPSQNVLNELLSIRPQAENDRFLRSVLNEKIFFSAMSNSNPRQTLDALQQALTLGYPAAHLYNDLGVFWVTQGNTLQARQAFESALRSPINHTAALENLKRLGNVN